MVCGSIGCGGIHKLRGLYDDLSRLGLEVLRHVDERGWDYSDIQDFRDKKDLSNILKDSKWIFLTENILSQKR